MPGEPASMMAAELQEIQERLEELQDAALDTGMLAVSDKLLEVVNPLSSAAAAAAQYADGTLKEQWR